MSTDMLLGEKKEQKIIWEQPNSLRIVWIEFHAMDKPLHTSREANWRTEVHPSIRQTSTVGNRPEDRIACEERKRPQVLLNTSIPRNQGSNYLKISRHKSMHKVPFPKPLHWVFNPDCGLGMYMVWP